MGNKSILQPPLVIFFPLGSPAETPLQTCHSPPPSISGQPLQKMQEGLTSDTPGEAPATMCPPLLHGVRSSVLLACETERNWCFLLSPAPSWELTICCRSKSAESPSWKHEAVISIHPQKALPGKELEFGEAPDEQGVRNAGCH